MENNPDSQQPRNEAAPQPEPVPPEPSQSSPEPAPPDLNPSDEELAALRELVQRSRKEVTLLKFMLYAGVLLVLGVFFYLIQQSQGNQLQDMETELFLSQNQAALNLGIAQKTLTDRIEVLENRLEQLTQEFEDYRKMSVSHKTQLSHIDETVAGMTHALALLKRQNSPYLGLAAKVEADSKNLVTAYKNFVERQSPEAP